MDPKPPALETLRRSVDDQGLRARLINLADPQRGGCLHLRAEARSLRNRLALGTWVDASDPMLAAADDAGETTGLLGRFHRMAESLLDGLGIESLMFGLGFATWRDEHGGRTAPLLLVPAAIRREAGTTQLRSLGDPRLNPALLRRLGLTDDAFPEDPLDYRPRADATHGIVSLTPGTVLGPFTTIRLALAERLDPDRFVKLGRHPVVARLTGGAAASEWSGTPADDPDEAGPGLPLDARQRQVLDRVRAGESVAINGAPGTGKTQTLTALALDAASRGKHVLIVSDTVAALETAARRIAAQGRTARVLTVYGREARTDRIAAALDRPAIGHAVDLLRDLNRAQRPNILLATTLSYVQNVPEEWSFDLVLIDEASQVAVAHALPAIAAARQVVVCGDPRQLPPGSLLRRALDNVVGNDVPMSLYDAAALAEMPSIALDHHYRSRHPGLIQGSNRLFYGDRLRIAPAPRPVGSRGLGALQVPGVFDRRNGQTNRVEAAAIVEHIRQMRAAGRTQSLLVIAATDAQRDWINDQLSANNLLADSDDAAEPTLVTTPDCAQGIERDIVLISLTYGPDRPGGRPPASFGTLSLPGGERRLNVMMTRARETTLVVTSVASTEITRGRSDAQNALITFLKLAERRATIPGAAYEGELSRLLEENHCVAKRYGQAVTIEDRAGRSLGTMYVTGLGDHLDERAEIAQLERNGWRVITLTAEEARAAGNDPQVGTRLRVQIDDFRTGL